MGSVGDLEDRRVIEALVCSLGDPDNCVQQAAVELFVGLMGGPDERFASVARSCATHVGAEVRQRLERVLANCKEAAADPSLDTVLADMQDSDSTVRLAAVMNLADVAEPGDAKACMALLPCLQDSNRGIMLAALGALGEIAEECGSGLTLALVECLGCPHRAVRDAAAAVLAKLARRGNPIVIPGILALAEHEDAGIRQTVAKALPQFADPGDNAVGIVLENLCADPAEKVQRHAFRALQTLSAVRAGEAGRTVPVV